MIKLMDKNIIPFLRNYFCFSGRMVVVENEDPLISNYMRFWYFWHRPSTKAQMSLCLCGSREGTGGPSLKNHKNIGFLSNCGPDPLNITKLPRQHSMLGHHQHASETPFKWRFAGWPTMTHLKWYLGSSSPHQLKRKPMSKLDPLRQYFLDPRMLCICTV